MPAPIFKIVHIRDQPLSPRLSLAPPIRTEGPFLPGLVFGRSVTLFGVAGEGLEGGEGFLNTIPIK